jgi:hypothetical protein
MINISGAPKWANGGQTPNHPPTSTTTLRQFAQMLAKRYNGSTTRGLVTRWSVWNEPNLQLFLTPQYSPSGKIVSPAAYLRIYKAAYAGIKAGNPNALVAVGETSNRGRDKPAAQASGSSQTDSVSPGNFAFLLSRLDPKLKFDAWATHPYPTDPFLGPTQKVKWPNVTLTRITQFGQSLQKWFGRRVPIWITEYGEQTKPQFSLGVSYAQQARDAQTALKMAAASPYVEMFVWFTLKDSASTWQSGFITSKGHKKPGYAAFSAVAKNIDGQTQIVQPGKRPTVEVEVPFIAFHDPPGATLGITYRIDYGSKLARRPLYVAQTRTKLLARNGTVSFKVGFTPAKGKQYLLTIDVGDRHGQHQKRTVALVTK